MDGYFQIPTLQETIEHMYFLRTNYDRSRVSATTIPGLYIEIKEPDWYMDNYGIDMGQALFDVLKLNDLETVEKATENGIPIIIQSFSPDALKAFALLSDLPRLLLCNSAGEAGYDWEEIATYAHGVGPASDYIMYWPAPLNSTYAVDQTSRSEYVDKMHEYGLQVHTYTLRIDHLAYTSSPAQEIALYANKGCDGVFTEFVSTTL